ncbi:transcription repressor OFP8 [Eucalyptus grandis]|uniref:transcription repressor OFP8 n=1 Tax=Eucalyptus grandis TaxID=71139 RepID=UPI00192EB261|nr:transcription repressor OFP8 [Eucalyptus grandis]
MNLRAKKLRFSRIFRPSFAASCSSQTIDQGRRLPRPPVPSFVPRHSLYEKTTPAAGAHREDQHREEGGAAATEEGEKEKCPYSSSTTSQDDWFSSDDESDVRLSSSRSLSPDSSETRRRRRRRRRSGAAGVGVLPLADEGGRGEIEDSFAVVKRSSDPRADFRRSMVEMIVEKEMFGAEELQKLLECFLALNSHHHHGVILQVFAEIWEALFSSQS